MNKIYKFQDGGNTYIGQNPNPTWYNKANSFLNNNPWGGVISSGIDLAGGLIKLPPGYSGKRGGILAGLDKTYDAAANAVMAIPGWGTVAGLGMKALGVLNKGMQRLGGGTDGMTTTDAILNSAFLAPIGWINGFAGKKANTYTRNTLLDAQSSAGFSGFQSLLNTTLIGAGKKYGLFSSGAREKQNELTRYTLGIRNTVSSIVDTNTINNLAAQSTSPFAVARFQSDINGGFLNLRAAAKGGKLLKFNLPKYDILKYTLGDDWQVVYDPYGRKTAIPSNLNKAQKMGIGPIPTQLGTIVYMGNNGKLQNKPVSSKYTIDDFRQGGFIKNVLNKYQLGNRIARTFKTIDINTGKHVEIPIPLSKELISGTAPIRLLDNTVVFMLKNGTVDSGRWETLGAREHLTPKGLEGIKIERKLPFTEAPKEEIEVDELLPYAIKFDEQNNVYTTSIDKNSTKQQLLNLENYVKNNPKFKGWKVWKHDSGRYFILPKDVANKLDWEYAENAKNGRSSGGNTKLPTENIDGMELRPLAEPFLTEDGVLITHESPDGTELYSFPNKRFKKGGKMNVIPEGALHARKNHLTDIDDIFKEVTHKGIPVITVEDGEVIQHAEVEHSEIIFTKEVTDKIEEYREEGTDEAAIACGKLLVKEILYNTDDRTGLIQTVE